MPRETLNPFNEALRQALALASTEPESALAQLLRALKNARASGQPHDVASLARNAAILSDKLGDLRAALGYYDEAIAAAPSDGYLHQACGDLQRRLGVRDDAIASFRVAATLAAKEGDSDLQKMAGDALVALGYEE